MYMFYFNLLLYNGITEDEFHIILLSDWKSRCVMLIYNAFNYDL